MLAIDDGLAVISLGSAVGSHHLGRIVFRNITLLPFAAGAWFRLILGQPFTKAGGAI